MNFSPRYTLLFFLVPQLSVAQTKWRNLQLDDAVSFVMPSTYTKSNTAGQLIFRSTSAFVAIQAAKIRQPDIHVNTEKELIDFYIAYQKLVIDQSYGDLVSDSTIKLNDLYARIFKFEVYWDDSLAIQENTVVLIDQSIYSFNYAYLSGAEQLSQRDRDRFFSGISFHKVDFEGQLTTARDETYKSGEYFGLILRYVTVGAIILAIALWFFRRYRYVKIIVTILSLMFLTWGAICVFIYIGNLFLGEVISSFLIIGIINLVVGFVLWRARVNPR
jgi:hypothetical protein